jgi:hypothetical protein
MYHLINTIDNTRISSQDTMISLVKAIRQFQHDSYVSTIILVGGTPDTWQINSRELTDKETNQIHELECELDNETINLTPDIYSDLNRTEALKLDGSNIYSDWDDDFEIYGVFGSESGFCYYQSTVQEESESYADRLRNTNL